MLNTLFARIPSTWIALVLGGVAAWIYLKYRGQGDEASQVVTDHLSGVILIYMIFSRFVAGLVFYFSFNLKDDMLSLLSGDLTRGWMVGLVASGAYLTFVLYRRHALNHSSLSALLRACLSGGVVFFSYLAITDIGLYRIQDVVRAGLIAVLFMLCLRIKDGAQRYPHRFFAAFAAVLFTTSSIIPPFSTSYLFRTSQWLYLGAILAFIAVEAFVDLRGANR